MIQTNSDQQTPHGQVSAQRSRLPDVAKPGKNFQHEMLVAIAARGERGARPAWMTFVSGRVERTLYRLLGPAAPVELLLKRAMNEASASWSELPADEPLSIWAQRIAVDVAVRYLWEGGVVVNEGHCFANARPGGVREVLATVYASMRKTRPPEQVAFALLELDGRSLSEAAAILQAPPMVVRQRAARVHRHLLFAARRDRLIARYVRIAARLGTLARRADHTELEVP